MPQMNVPMAGPAFSCAGVAAALIFPTTWEDSGSSIRCVRPVYSVRAMHLPSSITCVSSEVSNSTMPSGM
jgi:hypothetical protein